MDDAWSDVREAIRALKAASASKRKAEIKDPVGKLPLILTLLESNSPSSEEFQEVRELLREPLIPLYNSYAGPTMHLASVLLEIIHKEKVVAAQDDSSRESWELVNNALVAGALDYLDSSSTAESAKTVIAKYLFPVLGRHYFPLSSASEQTKTEIKLICNVYVLLSESSEGVPANQSKLREADTLGGKRIGLALSRSRDSLALERLLDLFASILPPRAEPEKQARFVDSVFDPKLFPPHQELKKLTASIGTGEWDPLSLKMVHVLAKSDMNFPQPVQINKASVSDDFPHPVGILFVDSEGFSSDVDKIGDIYDTFHVPYNSIGRIRYSSYSNSSTTVILDLKSPPTIGGVVPTKPQAVTLTFDIPRNGREHFMKCLKARDLGRLLDQGERKLSKSENELPLEFPLSQGPSQSFPEKASRVYDINPSSDPAAPTRDDARSSEPQPVAAKVHFDDNTSTSPQPRSEIKKQTRKKRASFELDDGVEKLKSAPANNKSNLEASKISSSRAKESGPTNVSDVLSTDGAAYSEHAHSHDSDKENEPLVKPKGAPTSSPTKPKPTAKRKAVDILIAEAEQFTDRPVKRTRHSPELEHHNFSSPSSPSKVPRNGKRYGRRGRPSPSPSRESSLTDLDAIPKAPSPPPRGTRATKGAAKVVASAKKKGGGNVASAMKGKGGKSEPAPAKGKTAEKAKTTGKPPAGTSKTDDRDKPATVVEEAKPTRRSARVSGKIETKPKPQIEDESDEVTSESIEEASFSAYEPSQGAEAKEIKKTQPKSKMRAEEKSHSDAQERVAVDRPTKTKKAEEKSLSDAQERVAVDKPTKTKKDKRAPWETMDFKKLRQENDVAQHTDPVSALESPTSGLDLPAQDTLQNDFHLGYKDIEVPLKVSLRCSDDSSDMDFEKPNVDERVEDISLTSEDFSRIAPKSPGQGSLPDCTITPPTLPLVDGPDVTARLPTPLKNPDHSEPTRASRVFKPTLASHSSSPRIFAAQGKSADESMPAAASRLFKPVLGSHPASHGTLAAQGKSAVESTPARASRLFKPMSASHSASPGTLAAQGESDARPDHDSDSRGEVLPHTIAPAALLAKPTALPAQAKVISQPPLDHDHLSVTKHEQFLISKKTYITETKSPLPSRAPPQEGSTMKLHKLPASTLLRKTALNAPVDARNSTPVRRSSEKPMVAPPSIKKQRFHPYLDSAALSPLPQFPQNTGTAPTVGRRGRDRRDLVRHGQKESLDSATGPQPPQVKNGMGQGAQDKDVDVQDIVQILQDIQEVIVSKLSIRLQGVKTEIRVGRDNILRAAAADIDLMRAESAEQYNVLVDIEEEYASYSHRVIEHLEDLCSIDKDIAGRLGGIIQHHDRHALSKKFPKSLPAFPPCFQGLNSE